MAGMLVLTRKHNEKLLFEGKPGTVYEGLRIELYPVRIGPNSVRLGIVAPAEINVVRAELVREQDPASDPASDPARQIASPTASEPATA